MLKIRIMFPCVHNIYFVVILFVLVLFLLLEHQSCFVDMFCNKLSKYSTCGLINSADEAIGTATGRTAVHNQLL